MEDNERQQLRELLRAHQSRLQVLELQQAQQGIQTPAQVITELADIRREIARVEEQLGRRIPTVSRAALRQLRQQALAAFYAKEWERAEELLYQVAQTDSGDKDVQAKLVETQRQLDLRAFYQAICDLRTAENWRAAVAALDDLEQQQPGYPDPQGLRAWAEGHRRTTGYPTSNLESSLSQTAAPLMPVPRSSAVRSAGDDQVMLPPKGIPFLGWVSLAVVAILGVAIVIFGQRWLGARGTEGATVSTQVPISVPALSASAAPSVDSMHATVAPTRTPRVAATKTMIGGAQFRVFNTSFEGLFLRPDHSSEGTPLKTMPDGTIVTVIGPDFSAPDRVWKHVRDPEGTEGWAPAEFLQAVL